jgi:hypothetical protein
MLVEQRNPLSGIMMSYASATPGVAIVRILVPEAPPSLITILPGVCCSKIRHCFHTTTHSYNGARRSQCSGMKIVTHELFPIVVGGD